MPPPITAMRSVMPVTRAACPSPPTCGGRGRAPTRKRREGEAGYAQVRTHVLPPPHPDPLRPQGRRERNLRAAPQALRGDCGAFRHRAQFLERDVGVELAVAGEGAEAAIAAGDDALAADDVGEAAD